MRHLHAIIAIVVLTSTLTAGCAAGRAFGRGESEARDGNWDNAVEHYRTAVQKDPNNPEYRIAYERAMISASQGHLEAARIAEARGQLEDALREYRRASEFDPPNRQLAAKVLEVERTLRDQIEAQRPRQSIQALREAQRQTGPPPLFNFNTVVAPLRFTQASLRDILSSIAKGAGINITYDSTYQDRVYSEYLLTVQGDTDSSASRERRRAILKSLLWSLYRQKDRKRLFSLEQRRILWHTDAEKLCAVCERQLTWDDVTVDHVVAYARGGRTSLRNAALAHSACNSRKGARRLSLLPRARRARRA